MKSPQHAPPRLSPPVFSILSGLVEERLGLHFDVSDPTLFEDRLLSRVAEAGFESALDYYYFLRYDPGSVRELQALADTLVVGETFFFREADALEAAIQHVLRPAIEERGTARIWSSACASGEEPLSLAMLLSEAKLLEHCEILATDLSERAIERARLGVYRGRSLRMLDPPEERRELERIAKKYLRRQDSGVTVDPAFKSHISYRCLNLLDAAAVHALGRFDLVLCRNVLIYFAEETTRRVVSSLGGALRRNGRLMVGASESLLRFGTELVCEERNGSFLYGKPS